MSGNNIDNVARGRGRCVWPAIFVGRAADT